LFHEYVIAVFTIGLFVATAILAWATRNLAKATRILGTIEKVKEEKARIAELIDWGRRLIVRAHPEQVVDSLKKREYEAAQPESEAIRRIAILLRESEDSELLSKARSIKEKLAQAEAGSMPVIRTSEDESLVGADVGFIVSRLRRLLPILESRLHRSYDAWSEID